MSKVENPNCSICDYSKRCGQSDDRTPVCLRCEHLDDMCRQCSAIHATTACKFKPQKGRA